MYCVYCIAPIHWCCSSYEGLNSELLFITFGIFRHFLCLFSFSINIYNYTFKTTIIQTVIFLNKASMIPRLFRIHIKTCKQACAGQIAREGEQINDCDPSERSEKWASDMKR